MLGFTHDCSKSLPNCEEILPPSKAWLLTNALTGEVELHDIGHRYITSSNGGRWRDKRWIGNGWSSLRCRVTVVSNNMPSCWYALRSGCSSPSLGQTNCLSPAGRNLFTKRSS